MAEQYLFLILAENFYDLVFAAYLTLLGKKVRVVARKDELEDSQTLLLLDPFRSQLVAGRLGLPLKKEKDPFTPDFQILSSSFRLDFFWDRPRRKFSFSRDLAGEDQKFLLTLDRLFQRGKEFEEKVRELPLISAHKNREFFLRLFSRAKGARGAGGSVAELFSETGIPRELANALLAPLRIFSPHFQASSAFFSAALLWRYLLSGEDGVAAGRESWNSFSELLTQSGSLISEDPVGLELSGKRLSELRLKSGRKIRADFFFAAPGRVLELLGEKDRESRRARALAQQFPRSTIFTHFYEMKTEAWPEAMSERVSWITGREDEPKEFLVCSKPLTGKSNQVSVSYGRRKGEVKPLGEEELFSILVGLFPWLKNEPLPRRKEVKAFHQYLKLEPSRIFYPRLRTRFANLFLSPSELVPLLGFAGLFRLAERLVEDAKEK